MAWADPPEGYLDAVGGQPLLPSAQAAWSSAQAQAWADPARLHHRGRRAGMVLDAARASIAAGLGVRPAEVFWASSAAAATAAALTGLRAARHRVGDRVVASAVESMAVLGVVPEAVTVPVDPVGRIDLAAWRAALEEPTAVACLQAANVEVGTRQPLAQARAAARAHQVPLLVDATQVIGHDPVPTQWDILVAAARDWGGPAGAAILVVRPYVRWVPPLAPDRGWVGGFPDIPAAAAAATALETLASVQSDEADRHRQIVARLRDDLPRLIDGLDVAGDPHDRLPHILTFTLTGVTGEAVVTELDRRDIAVASGSACAADNRMPSHVLAAMGLTADASVRVSLPYGVTASTIARLVDALPAAVQAARTQRDARE